MLTDDPDPPGNGKWEINIAATLQTTRGEQQLELPLMDINYGLGGSLQLKWESGLGVLLSDGAPGQVGWEDSLVGVKWRFLNGGDQGFSLGTYPQAGFRFLSSDNQKLAGPDAYLILPFEVKKGFGKFAVDGEIGLVLYSSQKSGWMYGVCAAYGLFERLEALAELHETLGNSQLLPPGLIAQFGLHLGFNQNVALIASGGTTVTVPAGRDSSNLLYAGIQLSF